MNWRHSIYCGVQEGKPCTCEESAYTWPRDDPTVAPNLQRRSLEDLRRGVEAFTEDAGE